MCRNMTCHMAQQVQEYFLLEFERCRSTFDTVNPSTYLTTDPPAPPPKTMLRDHTCWDPVLQKQTPTLFYGEGWPEKVTLYNCN